MYKHQMDKTEAGVIWYKFDWKAYTNGTGSKDWLAEDETILSYIIVSDAGLTISVELLTDDDTSVSILVSGGTFDEYYDVSCTIETSEGQTEVAIITFKII